MHRSRPPRIAIVTPLSHVRDAALYVAAAHRDVEVLVVVPEGGPTGEWPADVTRRALPVRGRSFTRSWMTGLVRAVREFDADLVHVHNEPWAVTTHRMVMTERPVVVHSGENLYRSAPRIYRARRFNTTGVLKRVEGYVNWGVTGLREAERAGLPPGTPRAVIPASPPSPEVFSRAVPPAGGGRLRVVFVGRLVPEKGTDLILRAVACGSRRERVEVTVVGEGPDSSRLRRLAGELGVRTSFRGRLDAVGTHDAIADGHVVVVPSRSVPRWTEQWGRAAVEAMMTGRAVLVSDSGELPHVVDHADWVFREGDPESLGVALDALLDDPVLLEERAQSAFERSLNFDPEALAEQLVDFWDEVLRGHGTPPC